MALDAVGLWEISDEPDRQPVADEDHSDEYTREQADTLVTNCETTDSRKFCECAMGELMVRFTPSEMQRVAVATRAGADQFDDLPDDLEKVSRDAAAAVEEDCR
jgi:hypothetical protein